MVDKISIITTHFYDFDWTELLIKNIQKYTDPKKIEEIIIINQDRNAISRARLSAISPIIRVIEYPKSEFHFKLQGHDHAYVLNSSIFEAVGDYICIFDSDAHPINNHWLETCESIFEFYDAILALVPGSMIDTHPCFMFLKRAIVSSDIKFDENLRSNNADTGRMVGKSLLKLGMSIFLATPTKSFNGLWGNIYLDVIYHHKSASFSGAEDERIRKRSGWRNIFFKKFVVNYHRYELSFREYLQYKILNFIHKNFASNN